MLLINSVDSKQVMLLINTIEHTDISNTISF